MDEPNEEAFFTECALSDADTGLRTGCAGGFDALVSGARLYVLPVPGSVFATSGRSLSFSTGRRGP